MYSVSILAGDQLLW